MSAERKIIELGVGSLLLVGSALACNPPLQTGNVATPDSEGRLTTEQRGESIVYCNPDNPETGLAGFGAYKQPRGGVDGVQFVAADGKWHPCSFGKKK